MFILSYRYYFMNFLILIPEVLLYLIQIFILGHHLCFFIPTYAIISGILGRVYIKKFYTSFSVFCIFWLGTLFISYSITNPNYSPPIELLFILTAYMAAYAVFYGMTFTISYYFQKRNSGGR